MKKTSWAMAVVATAALSLPAFAFAAKAPVVIGVALAETGPASSLAVGEVKSINMFVKQANAKGGIDGHPIKVVMLDTGMKPQKAVLDSRKLITQEHAVAVICCTTTPESMAILNTMKRNKTPNISLAASATIVEPVSKRYWIFKTPPVDEIMAKAEVADMKKRGVHTIAFMRTDDGFGLNGLKAVQHWIKPAGIKIVAQEEFQRSSTNMSAQAVKAVASNPDAVVIWSIPPSANVAQKAVQQAGYKGTIYQSYGVSNATFLRLGGASLNGTRLTVLPVVVYNQLPDSLPFKPIVEKFVADYKSHYNGESPSSFAGHAYDAMKVLTAASTKVLKSGKVKLSDTAAFRVALRDAIENLGTFQAVDGTFNYSKTDHDGLGETSAVMTVINDGKYHVVNKD